jgi:hypothetical protein
LQLLGKVLPWKDTSIIEVRYHPNRTYENWSGNNHKFEKVNSWRNEWFTITKMLEHDKANNRINVQIKGMKNRWIYYLEQDGQNFIDILRTGNDIINLKSTRLSGQTSVEGLDTLPAGELKRGDADKGVYGFRVALQKEGTGPQNLTNKSVNGSILRDIFDAVSVRVHLKNKKVDYISIPNTIGRKRAHITKINCYRYEEKTVVLGLTDVLGSKILTLRKNSAAPRRLFLGDDENRIGKEGRQLLKFLVDHADERHCKNITDESKFKSLLGEIESDWVAPTDIRRRRLMRLVEAERRLVE